MNILIRTDSSITIGTGHLMRCLTLADALKKKGAEVHFICRDLQGNLSHIVKDHGHKLHLLPLPKNDFKLQADNPAHASWLEVSWQEDLQDTQQITCSVTEKFDWFIVDSYALDYRWEQKMRAKANKIMVIDDLADRKHDCDLLLDQNYYQNLESRYDGLVPSACEKLLGPKYALLRQEFLQERNRLRWRDGSIKRILIFFGGSDPSNETAKALEAVCMLNRQDISVDVVVGSANPNKDIINELCAAMTNVAYHCQVENMAQLMAKADLFVGAGGTTVWERCALTLPSMTTTIAKNQEKTISDMAESGYLLFLGSSEAVLVESFYYALEIVLQSPWLLISFAQKMWHIVDGKGVKRVAPKIMPLEIILRMATMDDCKTIYNWRNAEETRRYIFSPEQISFDKHCIWFKESIQNTNRQILIAELHGKAVGVLRYDIEGQLAVVSIYNVPGMKGYGIGTQIISAGSKWLRRYFPGINKIQAKVLPENLISKKAFVSAGYTQHHIIYEEKLIDDH
jgi:UDP-2,4-diacetamido-2,4,6-trideoxy-beta-L-altropyranose hydrolase